MTGREIVKGLMDREGLTNVQLANRLGVTQATMWARLNNKSEKDFQLSVFYEMIDALGYEIVLRKKSEVCNDNGMAMEIDIPKDPKRVGRPRKADAE